ncbi:MAG: hypothetical protein LBE67_02170 [Kocuria palustris]|nr:hypothetical protein [Kocuria palustris]
MLAADRALAALVQAKDPRRTLTDPVCALALDAAAGPFEAPTPTSQADGGRRVG